MTLVLSYPPSDFQPKTSVAAIYLEQGGKILLLKRSQRVSQSGLWAVPAGKIETGETALEAVARELKEETGIEIEEHRLQPLGCLYVRRSDLDYTYHMFHLSVQDVPEVILNEESEAFHWAAPHEFETLPLIAGGRAAYFRYSQMMPTKRKPIALVSVYLILERKNEILLGLRQNTGYCDGMWSLPAGHVEDEEPASHAMIREADEELGIHLTPDQLKVVHVMHRQSNRLVVDIFFHCTKWEGEIENREPQKCQSLSFFPMNALPSPLVGYHLEALKALKEGTFYSEIGWITPFD